MSDIITDPSDLKSKQSEQMRSESKSIKSDVPKIHYTKKFDQKMHDKYDIPARNKLKEILGDIVSENPNIYGEDMILNIQGCKYKYIELQVCATWMGEKFPHKLPYIYERKIKFSKETLFLIFNKSLTEGLLFSRDSITGEPRRIKKYSREFIYEIRWNNIMRVYLETLTPELIMLYP